MRYKLYATKIREYKKLKIIERDSFKRRNVNLPKTINTHFCATKNQVILLQP
jgi:hypothetical protein